METTYIINFTYKEKNNAVYNSLKSNFQFVQAENLRTAQKQFKDEVKRHNVIKLYSIDIEKV